MNLANHPTNATTREPGRRLLIIGASARAAAHSAKRAGYTPLAIDRFGDSDLQELCDQTALYQSVDELPQLLRDFPKCDWIYTGPLENHPDLLAKLARHGQLLGNRADVVDAVRDPWRVAEELEAEGLPSLRGISPHETPSRGSWLLKPLRSGGGARIERYRRQTTEASLCRDSHFLQQHIAGKSCSAVYLGARGRAATVGVTQQLVGLSWNAPTEFQYAGSIGPLSLGETITREIMQIGEVLAKRFALQGLFGVDFIIADERPWLVEVNPRYTASVEVLELAIGASLLKAHVDACHDERLPSPSETGSVAGKLVAYATQELKTSERLDLELKHFATAFDAQVADRPRQDLTINTGEPICTFLVEGETHAEVEDRLTRMCSKLGNKSLVR